MQSQISTTNIVWVQHAIPRTLFTAPRWKRYEKDTQKLIVRKIIEKGGQKTMTENDRGIQGLEYEEMEIVANKVPSL